MTHIELTQAIGRTFRSTSGDRTIKVLALSTQAPTIDKYEVEVLEHIFPSRRGRKTYLSTQTLREHYVSA